MLRTLLHLPRLVSIGVVRLYQLVLSPHLPSSCRYTPSCSQYAIEAIRRYGALKGGTLAAYRLLRCNPWGGHGYDPPRWFGEGAPGAEGPQPHEPEGSEPHAAHPCPHELPTA